MTWIWQQKNWTDFKYTAKLIEPFEREFLLQSGILLGTKTHINPEDERQILIDLTCDEAFFSSEIEGEHLNRDSLRSSLRKNFGFSKKTSKLFPKEDGISALMASLYNSYQKPLSDRALLDWQVLIMHGRWDIKDIGCYRQHDDTMQIVSGYVGREKIHYEAPPSKAIIQQMRNYINWFNNTAPETAVSTLSPIIRSGIAHLYFEMIHPFEDGNGRLGRALALKAIFQYLQQPMMILLSAVINNEKGDYYRALARQNNSNEITEWLIYFANIILKAQKKTQQIFDFVIQKKKFYAKFEAQLNPRQAKVIQRLFTAGIKGFEGGLSAKNYIKIAQTSASTATRDLQELLQMGAVTAKGELKSRRYFLHIGKGAFL